MGSRYRRYRPSRDHFTPEQLGYADPLEKEISGAIRTALLQIGCFVSTTEQRRRSGQTIGIPDLYVQWPYQGVRCWIEVKRPGEKPSAIQRAWHDAERAAGGVVIVATSAAEAVEAVCELKARKRRTA